MVRFFAKQAYPSYHMDLGPTPSPPSQFSQFQMGKTEIRVFGIFWNCLLKLVNINP